MKNILLCLLLGVFFNLNAGDFEDGYYTCNVEDEDITERRAKTLGLLDIDLIILETKLFFSETSNKYTEVRMAYGVYAHDYIKTMTVDGDKFDVYGYDHHSKTPDYNLYFFSKSMMRLNHRASYGNLSTMYSCKKASFFKKTKMMLHYNIK
jgi:hypothetical protein